MRFWEAELLAAFAHLDQKDKAGNPYIDHVRAVAGGLVDFEEEIQIGAVLHDVVEDTCWTLDELREAGVPEQSVRMVSAVTKVPGSTKGEQILRAILGGRGSTLIKISDNAHNSHPDRLALLDSKTRKRLEEKYKKARVTLWCGADLTDVKKIVTIVNPSLLPELEKFQADGSAS